MQTEGLGITGNACNVKELCDFFQAGMFVHAWDWILSVTFSTI